MSLSTITASGTLREDPEKRFTPTNIPVTNLRLEICYMPRKSSQEGGALSGQIVRVNAWRDLAEYCESALKAGDKVLVTGRALVNAFTTKEGKKRRTLEIDATSVVKISDVLELKPPAKPKASTEEQASAGTTEQIASLDDVISDTEEIPF